MLKHIFNIFLNLFFTHQIFGIINHNEFNSDKGVFFIPFYKFALGNTVGICDDYNQIGAFLGIPNHSNLLIFQGDALLIANNHWAGSLGLGMRFYGDFSLGVNAFYDYREGDLGNFHQLGMGFEALSIHDFDFRMNFYFPFSVEHKSDISTYTYPNGGYEASCFENELSALALNGEMGRSFYVNFFEGMNVNFAIGPYFLNFSDKNTLGICFRGSLNYREQIYFEVVTTHDSIYNTFVQGSLKVSLPLHFFNSYIKYSRPIKLIERFDGIILKKCCNWHWNW